MIVFINDIPLRILRDEEAPDFDRINTVIDADLESISPAKLINHVFIQNVDTMDLKTVLALLDTQVPSRLIDLILKVDDYETVTDFLKSRFKIIKAAGGLVKKKEKFLMIHRMKKWDLPKGKKEKGETYKQTAAREVEEECNIKVKLGDRICTTWHTYTMNKRAMLKKTRWYLMELVDDAKMTPSIEEDIEEVRWMSRKEVYHALHHSYKSITYVFERYYAKFDKRK